MKEGRYFRIPQGPADLEQLWCAGQPLRATDLPDWVTPEDVDRYRHVGSASWPNPPAPGPAAYWAEMDELEEAGLIIDEDPADPSVRHFYLKEPPKEPVWSVGIYAGESPFRLAPLLDVPNPVLTHEDVSDVPATFIADPFMVRAKGAWFMFFEVWHWRRNLGEIGLAVSPDGLKWDYQQIVLAEPFHLSYPYVFAWRDDYFMIPETHQAGAVRLYQAREFPCRWEHVATLLEGPYLADASVFRHGGRWWMFADTSTDQRHDTLRLYHADDLRGPWREHPQSPLIQGDPCTARPAGRVVANGRPVRFTQTCEPYYGTAVRAFEVTELTATEYDEREAVPGPILKPSGAGWNACGMHHVDAHALGDGNWLACVDGWVQEEVLAELRRQRS